MVFVVGGGAPTKCHTTLHAANLEAERLSAQHRKRAYVLLTTAYCEPIANVKWTPII